MKRVLAGVLTGALVVASGAAFAAGQDGKVARGKVTTVGPDSVTVKVKNTDMKFGVDAKTRVTATGGSTAARSAQAEGKAGALLSSVVKEGQTVEVHYSEPGMHASSVRVMPGAQSAPADQKAKAKPDAAKPATPKVVSKSTAGTVTAMTGSSLTVKASTGDSTFVIDGNTKVIGPGLGTKSREQTAAGKTSVLADMVGVGDSVSVTWHEEGASKLASSVRLRSKATKK